MAEKMIIVIPGLARLDAVDLAAHQKEFGGAELLEPDVDKDAAGVLDPVTAVVFSLGVLSIRGLIAWMLKDTSSDVVEREVIVRRPDGTEIIERIRVARSSETTGENISRVMEQLGA